MKKKRATLTIVGIGVAFLLGPFLVAGVIVGWPEIKAYRADVARARLVVHEATVKTDALHEAARKARETMAPDAPIPGDWTPSGILAAMQDYEHEVLLIAAKAILKSPGTLSQRTLDKLDAKTALAISTGRAAPIEIALAPSRHSTDAIVENVFTLLIESDDLRAFEAGMDLGLCVDVGCHEGRMAGLIRSHLESLATLYAVRAVGEARRGEPDKALQTCFRAYAALDLLTPSAGLDAFEARQRWAERADPALWYVLDEVELTPETKRIILEQFERRKETTGLVEATQVSGAQVQTGNAVSFAPELSGWQRFALARGALVEAEKAVSLLELPPTVAAARLSAGTVWGPIPRGASHTQYYVYRLADRYASHFNAVSGADAARVAVALKEYKAAEDAYPRSLAGLLPDYLAEIPVDSKGGPMLQYEPSEEGFILRTIASYGEHRVVWRARR